MKLCTKPFVGAIKPPRDYKKWDKDEQFKEPEIKLELEYVYGYRAKDQRNNIKYLKNGSIAYTAAAVGIILDIKKNTQSFYRQHGDDITAFDVNPDGIRIATGDTGAKPNIYVWNSNTFETINTFKGLLKRGIDLLGFTPDGNKIAASGRDDDHTIVIYDLTDKISKGGCKILDQKGGRDIMLELRWRDNFNFITVGPKHYKQWTQTTKLLAFGDKDKKPEKKEETKSKDKSGQQNQQPPKPTETNPEWILLSDKGKWGKNDCSDKLTTIAINGNDAVCGAQDGSVQIFNEKCELKNFKKLHSKSVQAIFSCEKYIFTGGNDSKINVLSSKDYSIIFIINESVLKESICPKVRSICLNPLNNRQLIVGTYGAEIFELNTKDPQFNNNTVFIPRVLMQGHYTPNQSWTNEVWGLSTFPNNKDLYATCSDDATLRLWSRSQKKQLNFASTNIDEKGNVLPPNEETKDIQDSAKGRRICISQDGNYIIVGCLDGTIRIYTSSMKQYKIFRDSQEEISDIKISPNMKFLAIGSHDNYIYIYNLPGFKMRGQPLKKHSSYITHLDFSEDGRNLQSTCGAYELLFWDIIKMKQMPSGASQLRDERWNTFTVPIGWPVQGIYRKGYDGTDINAVDRSNFPFGPQEPNNYYMVATGDDYSKVNVLKFPSIKYGSNQVQSKGHSSHVTNVKWTNDDKHIISTGGEDQCVFQWAVQKKKIEYKKPSSAPGGNRNNSAPNKRNAEQISKYFKH